MYRNQLSVIKNEYETDLHKLLVSDLRAKGIHKWSLCN